MVWKIMVFLILILSASQLAFSKSVRYVSALAKHQDIVLRHSVSLVRLLAHPRRFAGKRIWVTGCFKIRENSLYLSREDALHCNCLNAIRLSFDKDVSIGSHSKEEPHGLLEELDLKHVGVEGTFHPLNGLGGDTGKLSEINRIVEL